MKRIAFVAALAVSASCALAAEPKLENPQTLAILEAIKGKEDQPAEKVFLNIKALKGVPAGRLLRIMEFGYARALGVQCSHCHLEEEWAVDDKRPKKAARDMIALTRAINAQLQEMKNLDTMEPVTNCWTCHRGSLEPGK
jgi:hypothetical protein